MTYPIDPRHESYARHRDLLKERYKYWGKARANHKNEFAELKVKLEAEFRGLLGIKEKSC
jgi:hypothetical protein